MLNIMLLVIVNLKETEQHTTCLGIELVSKHDTSISISDVYAVEFIDWGLVHETLLANPGCLLGHASEVRHLKKFTSLLWVMFSFLRK